MNNMKKMMRLYYSFKTPIRASFFGFILLAIGFLIKNENVNLFYTFQSSVVLFLGEFCYDLGEIILMNLPLIFMLSGVMKKSNNGSVLITALIGYITFLVTMMLFGSQTLDSQAYSSGYGINSMFSMTSGSRLPFETGLIGSLLVATATRVSFVLSRHRGSSSLLNLLSKEGSGILINIVLCFILGTGTAYLFPYVYSFLQKLIVFISENLLDPFRIGIYAVADRFLSTLCLGNMIRYPFWYTSTGGSFSNTATGQVVLGDINIWNALKDTASTYVGAGRFVTFYYVINMFIVPGFYLGTLLSVSDRKDRRSLLVLFVLGMLISIVAGNPLPVEMMMLCTTPLLYVMYLLVVGVSSYFLVYFNAFLGYSPVSTSSLIAMPGSFPDFIVNVRNANLIPSVRFIVYIGLAAFVIMAAATMFYYRYMAYDMVDAGTLRQLTRDIIDSVNGKDNIQDAQCGLFKLNLYLNDPEAVSYEKLMKLGIDKITETKTGICFETGSSSYRIAAQIRKNLKKK